MTQATEEDREVDLLERLADVLDREAIDEGRALLAGLHPAEVASLLESLPQPERDRVWKMLDPEQHSDVLAEAEDAVRTSQMLRMEPAALAAIAVEADLDDAVDILQDLPEEVIEEVLEAMDEQNRLRVQSALAYDEDSAGGLMNTDAISVRADVTIEVVIRYLRRRGEIPEKTNRLMVVDRESRYLGMIRIADLLIHEPSTAVADLVTTDTPAIPADAPRRDVALLFEQRNLISAPVVDDQNRVIGRITIDDVVDVIRDEAEHPLMSLAGLDEEDDMFAPVMQTARDRTVWLGVNLATALLASWVIGWFEAALKEVVALAVLMPVVASMGGIAGSQTLTVVIRGMALGQVGTSNARWLLAKELLVGFINGVVWSVAVGGVATVWFHDTRLGAIIGVALIVNLAIAALAGATIPLVLRALRIDPAIAGSVLLTTVTDCVGFFAFLGLGTMFLLR